MIIIITTEALFDLLQTNKANFRSDYKDYEIEISSKNEILSSYETNKIEITKSSVMSLIMNKNLNTEDFTLIVREN